MNETEPNESKKKTRKSLWGTTVSKTQNTEKNEIVLCGCDIQRILTKIEILIGPRLCFAAI